jgi:uncharacterized RDD family membrane protein YckC
MQRVLTADPLAVHPALVGRPLAPPARRAFAFGLDVALILLPSLLVSVAVAGLALRLTEPAGFRALIQMLRGGPQADAEAERLLGDVGPLLLRVDAPGLPPEAAAAFARGDRAAGVRALREVELFFTLRLDGDAEERPRPGQVVVPVERLIPAYARGAALFGVPALYFTLLTSGGRRTVGKRLLGLRVVRLDGRPLRLWESFERFGGLFAVPGTLGLGLLELWRDPNRRLAHDRGAETVVLRERGRG